MSEKKSGKALPILSIVFFGVSLVAFMALAGYAVIYRIVLSGGAAFLHSFIAESGKTAAMAFPAVFFIISAALYLKQSPTYKKLFTVSLMMQFISAVIIAARLVYANALFTQNASLSAYPVFTAYVLVGLLSLISAVLLIKDKKYKTVMIIAAAVGMCIAVYMLCMNVYAVAANFAYYSEHIFLMGSILIKGLLYFLSLGFYYIAFLFAALFKKQKKIEAKKVKVAIKAS